MKNRSVPEGPDFAPLPLLATDALLQTSMHVVGSISCIACLFVFGTVFWFPRLRTTINYMICWLTLSDFMLSFCFFLGTWTLQDYSPSNLVPIPCLVQGLAVEYFDICVIVWNILIPLHCTFVVKGSDITKTKSHWLWYHLSAWGLGIVALGILFLVQGLHEARRGSIIGQATFMCWISNSYKDYRIYLFHLLLWLQIVIVAFLYMNLFYRMKELVTLTPSSELAALNLRRTVYKAFSVTCGFIICWLPALLSRLLDAFGSGVPYWLVVLQSMTMPAHGLCDASIFLLFAYTKLCHVPVETVCVVTRKGNEVQQDYVEPLADREDDTEAKRPESIQMRSSRLLWRSSTVNSISSLDSNLEE